MTDQERAALQRIGEVKRNRAKGRYIDYVMDIAVYTSDMKIESLCNKIEFINTGTMPVMVKSLKIIPGAAWGPDVNFGEFDVTVYDIHFPDLQANLAANLAPEVTVTRKVYSNNPGTVLEQYGPAAAYNL